MLNFDKVSFHERGLEKSRGALELPPSSQGYPLHIGFALQAQTPHGKVSLIK